MAKPSEYFIKTFGWKSESKTNGKFTFTRKDVRFSLLTDRLLRVEVDKELVKGGSLRPEANLMVRFTSDAKKRLYVEMIRMGMSKDHVFDVFEEIGLAVFFGKIINAWTRIDKKIVIYKRGGKTAIKLASFMLWRPVCHTGTEK